MTALDDQVVQCQCDRRVRATLSLAHWSKPLEGLQKDLEEDNVDEQANVNGRHLALGQHCRNPSTRVRLHEAVDLRAQHSTRDFATTMRVIAVSHDDIAAHTCCAESNTRADAFRYVLTSSSYSGANLYGCLSQIMFSMFRSTSATQLWHQAMG